MTVTWEAAAVCSRLASPALHQFIGAPIDDGTPDSALNGAADSHGFTTSCVVHRQLCGKFVGSALDSTSKSLKNLASPTGFEPVLPP